VVNPPAKRSISRARIERLPGEDMPAIQITRLRIQVARLLEHFSQPEQFGRSLADLLDFYADRARRTGKLTSLEPIQKQYRVHPAVLKQINDDIAPYCRERPEEAAALAEWLWRESYYEPRLLAAGILAMLPDEACEHIAGSLVAWARPGEDRVLIDVLLQKVSTRLMSIDPKLFRKVIGAWLKDISLQQQSIGLRALCLYIRQLPEDLLPEAFKLVTPLPVKPASYLLTDLQDLVVALYARSSGETVYYLQELAAKRQTPDMKRFLRGCVNLVGDADRETVRALVL
jgi:hypothetical protein